MVDLAARCGFRFEARANRDDVLGFTLYAIGILHHKPAFVVGRGLKLEDASGKPIGRNVLQGVLVDPLVPDAQQRQSVFPCLFPLLAIGNRNCGIAVVIAIDPPFKS